MEHFATQHGKTTNSGTVSSPWPIPYALAGAEGKIAPGSILNVDIDKVCPFELPHDGVHGPKTPRAGFKVSISGDENNKTIIRFTGHGIGSLPEYRGENGRSAWRLRAPMTGPGINLWEGQHLVLNPADGVYVGGYFVGTDGKIYPLTSARRDDGRSITASSHIYNPEGAYYTGPTVMRQANAKPLIRLDHASTEAMLGKETIGPPSINPNECELHLFVSHGQFLDVEGSHLIIEGLNISFSYMGVNLHKTANHVTIRNGTICGGVNLIYCGEASHWLIDNMILDGLLDPEKSHLSWGDIKAGKQPADMNKVSCINPGTGSHGQVTRCILRNAFDGLAGGGSHLQVGGFAPYHDGMTVAEWDTECRKLGNHFDCIWDDAHQIDHRQRHLIHNHNLYTGAGISRDGSAAGTDFGSGRPLSLCNVFDGSQCRVFLFRKGRDITNPDQTGEGLRHPNTLSSHGPFVRPFPWIKVNDTEIWGETCIRPDQAKGLHGAGGTLQNLAQDEVNEEYNCIVIDKGVPTRNPNVYFRPWSDFLLDSTTGKEIRDGNLVVNLAGAKTYQRRLKTSASPEILINAIKTMDDLRNSQAFADSKAYYPPGIDANSAELNVSVVTDVLAPHYVPHHADAVQGAIDITSQNIPGCFLHRPWRGAVPPKAQQP